MIKCMIVADENSMWLGTKGGLIKWNPETNEIQKSFLPEELNNIQIESLLKDSQGNILAFI